MTQAIGVVREWKKRLQARDFERITDVVDLAGYTEICLGLTPWTLGFDIALSNYVKNMVQPWGEMHVEEEDAVADDTPWWHGSTPPQHTSASSSASQPPVAGFIGMPSPWCGWRTDA
jgi:hypothetical protein